jgi:hypothetical protein
MAPQLLCSAASVLAVAASLQTPLNCPLSDFRLNPLLSSVTLLGKGSSASVFYCSGPLFPADGEVHSLIAGSRLSNGLLCKASARTHYKTPPPVALLLLHDVIAGADRIATDKDCTENTVSNDL